MGLLVRSWLFCIQHLPCSMQAWRLPSVGVLNDEHSIVVYEASNSSWHAKNELALDEPQ